VFPPSRAPAPRQARDEKPGDHGFGAIQHASAAAEQATREVTIFGTIESFAVVLLLLRYWLHAPLLWVALALASPRHTPRASVFGEVHIPALVFDRACRKRHRLLDSLFADAS
jgi:hypothetical protein